MVQTSLISWLNWETDLKETNSTCGRRKDSKTRICVLELFLPSFPRFLPLWLSQHGALHDIWPSIFHLSTRFPDLQWLRWRFYGHKSNLKTWASWALDATRIIPGPNFLDVHSCYGILYDWINHVKTINLEYEISRQAIFECILIF